MSNKLTTPRKIITSSERPWGLFLQSLACGFYRQFVLESSLHKIFLVPKITMEKTRVLVKRRCTRVKTQSEPDIMSVKSLFLSLCVIWDAEAKASFRKKTKICQVFASQSHIFYQCILCSFVHFFFHSGWLVWLLKVRNGMDSGLPFPTLYTKLFKLRKAIFRRKDYHTSVK